MKIAAAQLHEALKVAMLGVAQNEQVEMLTHVWFTGDRVYGYDGMLYVEHALEADFKGSVRAATLWTLVEALSDSKGDADLTVENKELKAKIGRATLRIPFNEVDEFEQPKPRLKGSVQLKGEDVIALCAAIEKCLAVADPVGHLDFSRGVVLHCIGINAASVYGTDSSKLIRSIVELNDSGRLDPVILPIRACEAMLHLRDALAENRELTLIINESQVTCELRQAHEGMLSRVVSPIPKPEEKLPDFEAVISQHLPAKRTNYDLADVASDLDAVLQRAKKLMAAELSRWVEVRGDGKSAVFITKTQRGEKLRESVPLALPADFKCFVDVDGMVQGMAHGHRLYLAEKSGALYTGKSYTYVFPVTDNPT